MSWSIDSCPHEGRITIKGKFVTEAAFEFSRAYRKLLPCLAGGTIAIHMQEVEHIDTTALGILLVLHKDAAYRRTRVSLIDCRKEVSDVLEMANLGKLLTITTQQ